jgi:D-alanyl-D-alanine carboxypeptidase (penicillin-binding protein 5/6)
MSKELIKHPIILKYSNVWQDSIRDGEFVLTNTNRLVRYYSGCTGLKTGSTDKAGFCVSATAERDGMHLISVIMGSPTREERNDAARTLLDFGFSSYAVYKDGETELENVHVKRAQIPSAPIFSRNFSLLIPKGDLKKIEKRFEIPEFISGPVTANGVIGKVTYWLNGEQIGSTDIIVKEEIKALSMLDAIFMLIKEIIVGAS